jgi:hypothetical protein
MILPGDEDDTYEESDLTTQAACVRGLLRDRQPGRSVGVNKADVHMVAVSNGGTLNPKPLTLNPKQALTWMTWYNPNPKHKTPNS